MTSLGIIAGSGFADADCVNVSDELNYETPYGKPSSPIFKGRLGQFECFFLLRHGPGHTIPPHAVNYRANLYALHDAGIRNVLAIAAVGGIDSTFTPGSIVIPDQIIDYTWGRNHTFFDGREYPASLIDKPIDHIDFTLPFCPELRRSLIDAARTARISVIEQGVYGAVQGPRLETAAEILRMQRDGADMVGMTAMPEAALARELGMNYCILAMVVNPAAGKSEGVITMNEILTNLQATREKILAILARMNPVGFPRLSAKHQE